MKATLTLILIAVATAATTAFAADADDARKVLLAWAAAAETGDLVIAASEPGTNGGVMSDTAAEQVTDEGFDGVGFVEGHLSPPTSTSDCSSARDFIAFACAMRFSVSRSSTVIWSACRSTSR